MFAVILIFILFLPGAFLPVVLKTAFTSSELTDMGIFVEDMEERPIFHKTPSNRSHNGSTRLRASPST